MSLEKLRKWNDQWPHWKFTEHQQAALTELFADYARLQEQVETLTRMSDAHREHAQCAVENSASLNRLLSIAEDRAEVAEAERAGLREENDRLKRGLMGMAMFAKPAALKKEPQP